MSYFAILALLPLAFGALTPGTTYTISPSSHPDYCLAPASNTEGADLVLKKCDTSSDIVFTLDGDNLKNTETNMCVDIRHGENQSGTLAQMWNCFDANENQQFDIVGDEMKWIGRDKCLDLKDGEGVDGQGVQIWACYSHNTNQKWTFVEAEEVEGDDCETGTSRHCSSRQDHTDLISGSSTSPSTPAPSATTPAQDCEETDEEYEVEIPEGTTDDSDAPYCDEIEQDESSSDDNSSDDSADAADNSYTRRGRGQLWQRSLDEEFAQLDRRYIPKAPAGIPRTQRRSRRHTTVSAPASVTATGL
jgi:hypothetical protein